MRDESRLEEDVLNHLENENNYTEKLTSHLDTLRTDTYKEMIAGIKETDYTVPSKRKDRQFAAEIRHQSNPTESGPYSVSTTPGRQHNPWKPWKRFARAGSVTPMRMAHSGFGLASLFYGTADVLNVVVHCGLPVISYADVVTHAVLTTIASALSLSRAKNKWTEGKLWHLWMPTAREASILLAVIQNAWYTLILLSDYVRPPDDAWFAMDQPLVLLCTWFSCTFTFYVTSRMMLEKDVRLSGVYATQLSNALYVLISVAFAFWVDALKVLFIAYDPAAHVEFASLISTYPEYTQIETGILLGAMYIANLSWALSSVEHYGVITKAQIGDLSSAITAFIVVLSVVGFVGVDDGRMAITHVQIVWDSMLHALPLF